jgi:ubiquinone/menaquinone biosynthesis C-methylase UbiE
VKPIAQDRERLIKAANRLYHDFEVDAYDDAHPEIVKGEAEQWQDVELLLNHTVPEGGRLLDVGSGTGFVLRTLEGMARTRRLTTVAVDLSLQMLLRARERHPDTAFLQADADHLPFVDQAFDVVTANSVLHHLPTVERTCAELRRVARPGAAVAIVHEPNAGWSRSRILTVAWNISKIRWLARRLIWYARHPSALRRRVLGSQVARPEGKTIAESTGDALAKTLDLPRLTRQQVQALVDVHSPTASGTLQRGVGVDADHIRRAFAPWKVVYHRTSAHLGILTERIPAAGSVQAVLEYLWPRDGSLLAMVLRRPSV